MCRIAGIIEAHPQPESKEKLEAMLYALRRGGPDDQGTYEAGGVLLGHRRLSIIDLSKQGHQPMLSEDGSLILAFNGEIYNFQHIKSDLMAKGYRFRSTTDSEVILYAYQEWGKEAFAKFNGMFAFALYDKTAQQVHLVRDHAGIKPLYYAFEEGQLIFASEVRAFSAYRADWPDQPNWKAMFLAFGSLPFPFTTLRGVQMLAKGSFLTLSLNGFSHRITRFHQFAYTQEISSAAEAEALIKEQLMQAVERHLIADAPLGVFLSGGIDSSLLTLLAHQLGSKKLNTLSVTFKEASFDESAYQKMVLERIQSQHTAFCVDDQLFLSQLEDVFQAMDQPSIDGVNSYFIAKCAHENGLKAVLSGLGGDEYFGGYSSFKRMKQLQLLHNLPTAALGATLGKFKDAYKRIAYLQLRNETGDYLFLRGLYPAQDIARILEIPEKQVMDMLRQVRFEGAPQIKDENYASFLESNIYMENQLLKDTDFMSMWHALEVRVPFLDRQLLESVLSIAPATKYRNERPKYLLSHTFRNLLPEGVVFRQKYGFTFPFAVWLKQHIAQVQAMTPSNPHIAAKQQGFMQGSMHWSKYWSLVIAEQFRS